MLTRRAVKKSFVLLVVACGVWWAAPVRAQGLAQRCNWGVGSLAPTAQQWPASTQVIMMPTVMDFGGPPSGTSKVAFVSFANANDANRDGGGVLRIIDGNCREIARFPDPLFTAPIPPGCPATLGTVPDLANASGLAVGNIDLTPDVEIVGVIGGPTSSHRQIVAFTLVGSNLIPKWCSPPNALPAGDSIPGPSAPAIAQLDQPGTPAALQKEIIIDNKVFNFDGTLRYTGFSHNGNCSTGVSGGGPCPRSRTVAVADVLGTSRPQVITGRAIYTSTAPLWTGTLGWVNTNVSMLAPSLLYPAVAELDATRPGPEIVVTDTMTTTLRVLSSSNGLQLASAPLPNPASINSRCGGPPMIADAHFGSPGPEIGVASCTRYTLFRYSPGALTVLWSSPTYDPGGQTTSSLYQSPGGTRVVYTDSTELRVFDGASGAQLWSTPNTSNTSIEGPVIASLDTGPQSTVGVCKPGKGAVIVAANNYAFGFTGQKGVRIFNGPIGLVGSCWNQHTFHVTNVTNSFGAIPTAEPASWLNTSPARNTYRVQRW
jgi:hypothetical protein